MTELAYDVAFGGINTRILIEIDSDIFDATPADRDSLFSFVDVVKAAASSKTKATAKAPQPKPSRSSVELECDQCERTFQGAHGLAVHKARTHRAKRRTTRPVPVAPPKPLAPVQLEAPRPAPVSEQTPPLLERTGPIDLDAARARAAEAL